MLHTFPFRNFCHLGIIEPGIPMYTGVRKVSVHPVNLGQIAASTLRTYIHLQLLMSAIVTICQRQVDTLIEAHVHCPPDQGLNSFYVIINGVLHILNLTTIAKIPESVLQILLLDGGNILRHMTVEAVAHVLPVRHALYNTIFFSELLYLQPAQILCGGTIPRFYCSPLSCCSFLGCYGR